MLHSVMGDYFLDKAARKVNLLEKNEILLISRSLAKLLGMSWTLVGGTVIPERPKFSTCRSTSHGRLDQNQPHTSTSAMAVLAWRRPLILTHERLTRGSCTSILTGVKVWNWIGSISLEMWT